MSLRPFFVYEKSFSAESIGSELLALTRVSRWRGLAAIALNWTLILLTITLAAALRNPLAYFMAILVVGARQHALLILMHDAAHYRLFPDRRWNDRLADWLCAYPHLVSTDAYRRDHLRHHRHVNSDRDPNWIAKIENSEWRFPKSRRELAWLFLKDLAGGGLWRMLGFVIHYERSARRPSRDPGRSIGRRAAAAFGRVGYFALVIGCITALDAWFQVLILWLVPLFSIVPALLRLRVIAEHHGLEHKNDMNHSRNYHPTLLERFFLAPHYVWLHLDHHLFPAIPHYHLLHAHRLLETIPEYRQTAHQSCGLLGRHGSSVLTEISAGPGRSGSAGRAVQSIRIIE
jgi:fatty acid desaturase